MREENIDKMNFKELRNEVQYLRDELAILTRKFNDAIYNLDSDNFGKSFVVAQNNMKAQIKINAKEIATKVSSAYLETRLTQTAEEIETSAQEYVDGELSSYSTITQTANKIRSVVSSNINNAEEVASFPTNPDIDKIYHISGTTTYYYYDANTGLWVQTNGSDLLRLYTVFQQTNTGFALKGNVKVDGSLVAGTLDSITIKGSDIYGATYLGVDSNTGAATRLRLLENEFQLYKRSNELESFTPYFVIRHDYTLNNQEYPDYSVYFDAAGQNFLEVTKTSYTQTGATVAYVSPKGVWNFSECTDIDWGSLAPTAVFG